VTTPARQRISVLSTAKMVLPQLGKVATNEGESTLLFGWTTPAPGSVAYVTLDDGRDVLIARSDLTAVAS
jgi:RecA-family ATPase